MRKMNVVALAGWLVAGVGVAADGVDWPRWRGLNGDGISPETGWRTEAVAGKVNTLWRAEVGQGYSAISVSGPRAYTMGNVENQDVVYCLDVTTGREVWRHVYACKADSYPGPRATPAVTNGLVYTFGRAGDVFCLDAATGAVKWTRNVVHELKAGVPRWGFAGSPVIEGKALLLNAGPHGMALDAATGRTLWESGAGTGGYSAPVVATIANAPTVLMFGEKALRAVELASGKERWSVEWITRFDVNAADPLPIGDKIWMSSGYKRGGALLDCAGGKPVKVWENQTISAHFSSAVFLDGYIYGMDGNAGQNGNLICLKPDSGDIVWSQALGFGSLILSGKRLIVFNEKGSLYIVAASPDGYRPLASAEGLLPAKCWTAPTLSRGLLYLRNDKGTVLCLDLN